MIDYKRTKITCFYTYFAMSSVFCLPPMLFVTFRQLYGISYTLLGTLVLLNFCTQLAVDLILTFFAKHFNVHKIIRKMPLLTAAGLAVYALIPNLFPQYAYGGLVAGTVLFSIAAGMSEVLVSPTVAAIPSETPDKDMSLLHSLYGYGVVAVVLVSTVFFAIFGTENWMYLTLGLAVLPVIASVMLHKNPLPPMQLGGGTGKGATDKIGLFLCTLCIFWGSATENTMTNWISTYMENALNISKTVCDVAGLALFAVLLAMTRTWYTKYGSNIQRVLLVSMVSSIALYLVAGISSMPLLCLIACVLLGLSTSMLWPGTLILMEEKLPGIGVTAYALMAAGGDFGGSVAPQLMGVVVDTVAESPWALQLGTALSLTPEQIGMKTGMLIAALFPVAGTVTLLLIRRHLKRKGY